MPDLIINGVRLYYEVAGEGDPVVVLHGGMGTARLDFGPQIDLLAREFRVYAVDQRGYGRSEHIDRFPDDYLRQQADDTIAWLDALGVKSALVLGFSDGGIVGLYLAIERPDLVRGLVAVSASCELDAQNMAVLEGWLPIENWPERWGRWARELAEAHGEPYWRHLLAEFVAANRRIFERGGNYHCDRLHLVRCPVLVVHGGRDRLINPKHAETLHRLIPSSELVIFPDCGHNLHRERPEEFNRLMLGFFRRVADRAGGGGPAGPE